ncbi:hypothetical protein BCV70DRAFT_214988 [Testicularia cyperi]|uniref:Uncharacterized protein n=1 Tax=Testicularia cyperi TaxID=1882483 RepID=A0A317Y076_9BASI|nr:hypothetical protein BCV70DRAFT_214988 [Testicularia cyperi]
MAWASSRGPFDVATYHHTTTACESKIASTGAAFTRSDLARLDDDRASNAARAAIVMRLELAWLVWRLQERFGWQAWDSDASTAAFREQGRIEGWEKGKDAEEVRQTKARQMVFSGAAGQRRF